MPEQRKLTPTQVKKEITGRDLEFILKAFVEAHEDGWRPQIVNVSMHHQAYEKAREWVNALSMQRWNYIR